MRIVRAVRNVSVLLLAAGAALGCGGGGGAAVVPDPNPPPPSGNVTLDVIADAALSGAILDSTSGRSVNAFVSAGQSVSPTLGNSETRGVAVYVWAIPTGATIVSATLRCTPTSVTGNPTTLVDALTLDHFDVGTNLDVGDFDGGPLFQASCATLVPLNQPMAAGTPVSTDVTTQVVADRTAVRGRSCFRLLFLAAIQNTQGLNTVQFEAGGVADAPVLTIIYAP